MTDFTVRKYEGNKETFSPEPGSGFHIPIGFPNENVKNLRVDVAPGVVTNPQAVPKCSAQDFKGTEVAEGVFTGPTCAKSTVIGKNEVTTVFETAPGSKKFFDAELTGKVYNLEQEAGQGSTYGVALEVGGGFVAHTIIKGASIRVRLPRLLRDQQHQTGLVESRLVFYGNKNPETAEPTTFIRNGTKCAAVGPETTTTVRGEFEAGTSTPRPYTSLASGLGCGTLAFEPSFTLTPESALTDGTDGITTETRASHPAAGAGNDTADLESIVVKMPEGMTMNPSAGAALEACEPAQAAANKESKAFAISKLNAIGCPSGSKVGTVNLEVPTAPEGAFQGSIYLGRPTGKSIEGPPYTIYLDAESARYGVRVLLTGSVVPNPVTGQLSVSFAGQPQAPFNNVKLHFNGGVFAPLANPLLCGTAKCSRRSTRTRERRSYRRRRRSSRRSAAPHRRRRSHRCRQRRRCRRSVARPRTSRSPWPGPKASST